MALPALALVGRLAARLTAHAIRQAVMQERARVTIEAARAQAATLPQTIRVRGTWNKGSDRGLMGLLVHGRSDEAQRKMRVAQAIALTKTAQAVQRELTKEIDRAFAQPVAFTKRAIGITPATRSELQASVFVRDRQAEYLKPQIYGGRRPQKRFEKRLALRVQSLRVPGSVPGRGVRLNVAGNIPRPTLIRLLQQAATKGSGVFIPKPGSALKPGIYRRVGRKAVPLLLFSQDAPTYQVRFDFAKIVQREVDRHWPIEIERAMRKVFNE